MNVEKIKLTEINEASYNPRKISNDEKLKLKNSLKTFGLVDPIIINLKDNTIIGGHQRYNALIDLSLEDETLINKEFNLIKLGDVGWVFDNDNLEIKNKDYEKALNLALNKISGEWDNDKLESLLNELDLSSINLELTGFDMIDIKELNINLDNVMDEDNIIEDDYYVDEETIETNIKQGDIFKLGNHRLMCGDSTNIKDVNKLIINNSIDLLFTDPPYNVSFNGRSGKFDVIKNDNLEDNDFIKFINDFISIVDDLNINTYYIWCNWKFYGLLQQKMDFKNCIVWAKNVFGLGKGYRHQHEFCLFNGKVDDDITNESDLWNVKKVNNNDYIHPTQKPIELCRRALNNHKNLFNILDLFGGSGSTLIACEQLNRHCYMMELDPKYCQVIINRWEEFTGEKVEKIN